MEQLLSVKTMDGQEEPLTGFRDFYIDDSTDGVYELGFSIYRTEKNQKSFDLINNKESIIFNGERFVVDLCDKEPVGTTVVKDIEAEHATLVRLDKVFIREELKGDIRANVCLGHALAGTGITYEIIGTFPSESFENFGHEKSRKLIETVMKRFKLEFRIYGTHLVVAKEIARVHDDAQFRASHNLKAISETIDTTNMETYIEGYSYDDESGELRASAKYTSPNAHLIKNPDTGLVELQHADYIRDSRFYHDDEMLRYLIDTINDTPDYNLKVEYHELKKNGLKLHDFDLGDYVWCIHDAMNIDLRVRIIKRRRFPYDKGKSPLVELGSFKFNVTQAVAGIQQEAKKISVQSQNIVQARSEANRAYQAAQNATSLIGDNSNNLNSHVNNSSIHVTPEQKQRWDNMVSPGELEGDFEYIRQQLQNAQTEASEAKRNASAASSSAQTANTQAARALTQANNRNKRRVIFIGNGTQTVYSLPFSYEIGKNQLDVYVGYTKRISGSPANELPAGFNADYIENSTSQITFIDAPPASAPIEILIREVVT